MKIFFWWKTGLVSLFPRIGRLLQNGTDRYELVRLLRASGFNVHESDIKQYMEEMHGPKRGYVEHVLIDNYQCKELAPFEKLSELITEPAFFRKDYNYHYSRRDAKKLAKEIRHAIHTEKKFLINGQNTRVLLRQNISRTSIAVITIAGFLSSIVTILQYIDAK